MGYSKKNQIAETTKRIFFSGIILILNFFQLIGDLILFTAGLILKLILFFLRLFIYFLKSSRSIIFAFGYKFKKIAKIKINLPKIDFRTLEIKLKSKKVRFDAKANKRIRIRKEKKRLPFKLVLKIFFFGFIFSILIITVPVFFLFLSREIPNPKILSLRSIPVTTKIFDRSGELLYEIYADQNRTPVILSDIPKYLREATIAIEDSDFYNHQGYSFRGIIRAISKIFIEKEIQGGSTITQQLIRSALLDREISLERKIKEIILAVWAEKIYTKDQILEMYFNQVPYGGTAWGVEAASQTYFGKSVKNLNLSESALLAGLPAAPSTYSPFGAYPDLAIKRQGEVLKRMADEGYISEKDKEQALSEKIKFNKPNIGLSAPHFVMYVRDLLSSKFGIHMVERGGLRVYTSLDLNIQKKAEEIVRKELLSLNSLRVGNAAVVVTDPKKGEILAMVGSSDYFDTLNEGNVNVALTLQQPGSAIKVVNYSAALENGFTTASLVSDTPITYKFNGSPSYSPVNYDGNFHGWVSLRSALGNSFNIPAVRVLAKIGVSTMIEQGRKMGIESWVDPSKYGLSLTLGGGEVTMLEMAQVYATLANDGFHQKLNPILKITDYQGNILEEEKVPDGSQAVLSEVAFIISDILSDNNARTAAFGPSSLLYIPGKWVAVKTGTSNEKRDNWAVGFTPNFVVTVWVGNNNNSPMHPTLASGITGATPIWREITDYLLELKGTSIPKMPENVVKVTCRGRDEYFIKGTEKNACLPIPTPSISLSPTPN